MGSFGGKEGYYQLSVEFCQPWLAGVVEDKDGVDHGVDCKEMLGCRDACRLGIVIASFEQGTRQVGAKSLTLVP